MKKKASSKAVGRFWQGPTGGRLQQRNEAAHAAARLQVRKKRHLSHWPAECALAKSHRENRWGSGGIKAGRGRPGEFCLPNHCFDFRARRAHLISACNFRESSVTFAYLPFATSSSSDKRTFQVNNR